MLSKYVKTMKMIPKVLLTYTIIYVYIFKYLSPSLYIYIYLFRYRYIQEMTSYCSNMGAVWSRTIYLPSPTIGSFSASFPSVLPSSPSGSSAFRFTSQAMTEWKAFVAGFFQSTPTQNPNNHLRFKGDDTFLQGSTTNIIYWLKRMLLQRARVKSL